MATNTSTTIRCAGALLVAAAALLGGCQKNDPSEAGPAERAGRKVDEATAKASSELSQVRETAGQQMSDAARDTSQKLDKAADTAGQKLNEATQAAGRKLEQAGEKMQEKAKEREAAGTPAK